MSMMEMITLPLALIAFVWGYRQLTRSKAPEREMRTMQLGRPVTDPDEKLALARQQGVMAIVLGAAMLFGPLLGS